MKEHPYLWFGLWLLIGSVIAQLVMHYRQMAAEKREDSESEDNEEKESKDE